MTTYTLVRLDADKDLIKQATYANISFEVWAIDTRQGYDLSREDRALMATYRDIKTEHAWRGYCYAAFTAQAIPAAEPVAWQSRFNSKDKWTQCSKEYHDWVMRAPEEFIETMEVRELFETAQQAAQSTTGAATTGAPSEPFGYFKAEPFGWTDCAEDDDGAVALYERPQQAEQAQSVRLEAAERLAADRLEQMNADRKQALVWRDQAELYEQVRKFSPREFQALWTKNITSGAMFDDLVRAAIKEAGK